MVSRVKFTLPIKAGPLWILGGAVVPQSGSPCGSQPEVLEPRAVAAGEQRSGPMAVSLSGHQAESGRPSPRMCYVLGARLRAGDLGQHPIHYWWKLGQGVPGGAIRLGNGQAIRLSGL